MNSPDIDALKNARDHREIALELQGVSRRFGGRAVLKDVSLNIRRGQFVSMLGASGAGKTTLLRILAGLDKADEGRVRVANARSVVFQEPRLVPARRVWENVVIGHDRLGAAKNDALAALDEVGLASHAEGWPKTLSGGEAQRVALARALVREPRLLLLDEPFAALDALTRMRMYDLVARLWRAHMPAVVLVTHDIDEAILLSDRIVVLSQGEISADFTVDFPRPRSRADGNAIALRTKLLEALGVTTEEPQRAATASAA
ncbi:ABC transporter ATP-binding protein [Caballeronia sp. GAWG1-1]|uniref:ABC transporter ATP-binding protein n=1 Tax=Caballeronia sp. GAWG1-1 TaxID=2921742 RepID=UPI002028A27D|nr:ABC transporter ATP-binding protein [Caballeronia sp. GAWG1-1]